MPAYAPWVIGGAIGAYSGWKLSDGLNLVAVAAAAIAAAYVTAKVMD